MKTTTILALSIALFSANAFAEKMIVKGDPLVLQKNGDIYIVPETYKVQEYQYVDFDGTKRACFLDKRADLSKLDVITINVKAGADQATWNCYSIDPTFFDIQK